MIDIQQGALATDQDVLNSAHMAALQLLSDPKTFNPEIACKLLNALATVSPIVRQKLGDIYQQDPNSVLANRTQVKRLYQICQELAQANAEQQQQIQNDLLDLKRAAQQKALEQQAEDTKKLQAHMDRLRNEKGSPHRQAIVQDAVDTVGKIHEAKRDKGVFGDPLTVLGILFEIWLQLHVLEKVDAEFYSKGFKFIPPNKNTYLDQISKENGGNVIHAPMPLTIK